MNFIELEQANKRADRHRGDSADWLKRHSIVCREAVRNGDRGKRLIGTSLHSRCIDVRCLDLAWLHVDRRSGRTPGPDGRLPDECTPYMKFDLLRGMHEDLEQGSYEWGATRSYRRRKFGGGSRTIHIANFLDRVVLRAVVQAVQPLLNPLFAWSSFGYRPKLSRFHALSVAKQQILHGQTVVLAEDLQDAFGSVPISRMLQIAHSYLKSDRLDHLLQSVYFNNRISGLPQGNALSPLLLNLSLHHHLDRHKMHSMETAWLRYADDIAVFCASELDAQDARRELERLLIPAGFTLKPPCAGETTIIDLSSGDTLQWLGFDLRINERSDVDFNISEKAWEKIFDRFDRASREPRESRDLEAMRHVAFWLWSLGPAYTDVRRDDVFARLIQMAAEFGLNIRSGQATLSCEWRKAYRQWHRLEVVTRVGQNVPC